MKTILFANQKGGVGKSMCADELAFSFERTGVSYNFYDLDSQGGTIHKTMKMDHAECSIVDTPGALQSSMADWMKEADVIVIPTRMSSRDIEPLLRMREIALANNSLDKLVFVLNGWNRYRAASDFEEWFEGIRGDSPIVRIPQSEQFVQAGAREVSVVERSKRGRPTEAILEFVNIVRTEIGLDKEALA